MTDLKIVERLRERIHRVYPADWQKGLKCPECGSSADRPNCMLEIGGYCPRNDPKNYNPQPGKDVVDPGCEAAADIIQAQHEALKYARRFLNEQDHDTAFVDAAIAKARGETP